MVWFTRSVTLDSQEMNDNSTFVSSIGSVGGRMGVGAGFMRRRFLFVGLKNNVSLVKSKLTLNY